MIETAVLTFALTMVASPPQQSAKAPKKPIPKIATVQKDQRFADFAKGVLKCYHPTARYQSAAIEKRPWPDQKKYGAKGSALVSIHPARDEDEIQRPFADDLVGDVDVAAAGEAGLRSHEASLLLVALRVSAPHGAIASGFCGSRRARLARNRNGQLGVAYYRR